MSIVFHQVFRVLQSLPFFRASTRPGTRPLSQLLSNFSILIPCCFSSTHLSDTLWPVIHRIAPSPPAIRSSHKLRERLFDGRSWIRMSQAYTAGTQCIPRSSCGLALLSLLSLLSLKRLEYQLYFWKLHGKLLLNHANKINYKDHWTGYRVCGMCARRISIPATAAPKADDSWSPASCLRPTAL
ncbi:hypothetical protein FIBSPDRAFT_300580 [Athelia psychrophila]|uniref:Uncharacterized protein n=1 Tax=Athelia psychrophila TaxID=1759441 RepID=A0A166QWG7_9AGAM|nr:hypothetical protein FIBSPDRAFT_300580 [Fibularhizoctonia sp. CBS 109695]